MINIKNKLNIGISFGIILLVLLGSIIWADSNGVWYSAQDIRGSIFGTDENSTNYTFMNNIFMNNNLTVNGYITVLKSGDSSNQTVTKNDVDSITSGPLANLMACNKLGMLYNGSSCTYATGADITPTSFSFTNVSGVEFNAYNYSNEVILGGFGTNLIFELKNNDTSSSIVLNGIDTGLTKVSVKVGDKIKIKLFSKNDFELVSSVDYVLGSVSGSFSVKTKADITFEYMFANAAMSKGYFVGDIPTGAVYWACVTGSPTAADHMCTQYCRDGWSWTYICKKLSFSGTIYLGSWENVENSFCGGGFVASPHTCNP